ncbi:MAG: 50S ribosomal protein L25 [Candidatus Nomurabacteria bacterium]|nr:50S ribosomal protein L25 [Candidatus Nomurabacteria bacterium]
MFVIKAKLRDPKADVNALRKAGDIPAVFYGMGKDSTSITVSSVEFKKVWHKAGESSTVKIESEAGNVDTLIHEVQVHPVTDEPIHVDFLVVDMNKKIKVHVPLEFVGISLAVKSGLGNLVKVLHEVEVEALPKDLPHTLEVDISKLSTLSDVVLVSDIKLPTGVEMITPLEEVAVSVIEQKEEKEEVAAPVDLSAIEVEKKGKKEEEVIPAAE